MEHNLQNSMSLGKGPGKGLLIPFPLWMHLSLSGLEGNHGDQGVEKRASASLHALGRCQLGSIRYCMGKGTW